MTDNTELAPVTTEPAYGREGLERDAGLVPHVDEFKPEAPEDLTTKEAAAERANLAPGETKMIFAHVTNLPANVTLTTDQAAKMLIESREADQAQAELDGTKAEQKAVDKLRGTEKPAAPQIETEIDVDRALANPRIRDAIAERVTAADTERARYEAHVTDAGKFAAASLFSEIPELANIPMQNWVSAIQAMHQREPARAQMAISKLQALARVEAASQQIKAQKTERSQSEFKAYAAKENARFAEMTKSIPAREMAAIEAHVPKMLAESGASVKNFLDAVSNQTTFPRASAEALLVKAARYDLMQQAAKAVPARGAVPTVQRPGHAGPRTNRADTGLAQLSARLTKSGSLKDAVALRLARSKGR